MGDVSCSDPQIRMSDDSRIHHRRTIRLPGRDYSAEGAYFVTACTINRDSLFGEIVDGHMCLNAVGNVVADTWRWLPLQYSYVTLDEWCVLPDHLHGILVLGPTTAPPVDGGATDGDVATGRRKRLGRLIGAFKTVSTKHINVLRNAPGAGVWQRGFWEHVVRDDADLARIRMYIRENAARLAGCLP
jgi:REP element-mobilizing transposase RayT